MDCLQTLLSISTCAATQRYGQAGRFPASSVSRFTNATFCELVGIMAEEYDAEVAACVREHAEKPPAPEAGAGAAGEAGGELAGACEIDG